MQIRDCVRWLWRSSQGFHFPVGVCVLTGTLRVGASLFFVYVSKHLIDIATGHSDDSLPHNVVWLIASLAAQLLLSIVQSRLSVHTEIRLRNTLHRLIFNHLMGSRWRGSGDLHTGDLLNRLEEDVATVTGALSRTLPSAAITLVQLTGAFLFLAQLDMRLAAILVFIMPVALLFSKSYVHKMRRMSREIRQLESSIQSHMQENLQHRILIRTLEYTARAVESLVRLQTALQKGVLQRTDFAIFSRSMVQLGFMTGYAVALLWGVFGLKDGSVTFGMMAAFLQLVSQVQRPIVDLSRQLSASIRVFISTERLAELTTLPLEEQRAPIRLHDGVGIRVEGVSFRYPDGKHPVLEAFSHDFRPGSLTAIVGETGVGKSTLIRLILALIEPDRGRIDFYDATREVKASPFTRCNLSYVPQGNTLMSGTIRDNLLMGNPDATDAELCEALHTAAADFVTQLPEGLDTRCGEQGGGLSEGQAQRIAIARGLLRPGGVLLLDEPTSALDNETERLLLQRLSERLKGRTLLLITHREAVAGLCTEIVRLEKRPDDKPSIGQ